MYKMFLLLLFLYTVSEIQVFAQGQGLSYRTFPLAAVTKYTAFVPKIVSRICLLKPDQGPCRGNIRMYFFNPSTMECGTFRWGGCQGNGNRFDSRVDCNRTCLSTIHTPKSRPSFCFLVFDYGYCFGSEPRWYFDRDWKVCKLTIYSGCGGNRNNFFNQEQCDSVCRFAKGFIRAAVTKDTTGSRRVIIVNPDNSTTTPAPAATSVGGERKTTCVDVRRSMNKI